MRLRGQGGRSNTAGRVLVALAAGLSLAPVAGWACSCARSAPQAFWDSTQQLVIARVDRVQYQRAWIGDERLIADVEVLDTLKSPAGVAPLKRVITSPQSATCGVPLQAGHTYVFAPWGDEANVTLCSSWDLLDGTPPVPGGVAELRAIRDARRRITAPASAASAASTPRR